jgi:hypothetical protein
MKTKRCAGRSFGGVNLGVMHSCLRIIGGISLVVAAACSGPDAPTTPSGMTPIAPALGSTPASLAPAQITPPPSNGPDQDQPHLPTGSHAVSGVVTDGVRAIAGANVNAWVRWTCSPPSVRCGGYSYMYLHGPVLTDSSGGFRLTGLPAGSVWVDSYKDGYVQQCAAPELTVQGDATVNLQLVAKANLTASTNQPPTPGLRSVSGVIVENAPGGKRPVHGVWVGFEPVPDSAAAVTYSDAAGRFLLCDLPQDRAVDLVVGLSGRITSVSVPPGQTDIEIGLP